MRDILLGVSFLSLFPFSFRFAILFGFRRCGDKKKGGLKAEDVFTGWAAASDVLLAIYPIIVYRKLQISLKDKVALFILFSGGVW